MSCSRSAGTPEDGGGGEERGQQQQAPARQLSLIYSLTFDEFQSTLGGLEKGFGSMNMDELLRSIWTAEESQAAAAACFTGEASGIQRQGSLSLPRTLSEKTVDEVFQGLVSGGSGDAGFGMVFPGDNEIRQQTLGEMTLEEFLVRAGVVKDGADEPPPANSAAIEGTAITYGIISNDGGSVAQHLHRSAAEIDPFVPVGQQGVMVGGMVGFQQDPGFNHGSDGFAKGNVELSFARPPVSSCVFSEGSRRNKASVVERVVERRQRRMIKNRESAARSRARKQAYTMELEAEVAKLKEQNQELQKKQAEIVEIQKCQAMDLLNHYQSETKRLCLRRTLTGP